MFPAGRFSGVVPNLRHLGSQQACKCAQDYEANCLVIGLSPLRKSPRGGIFSEELDYRWGYGLPALAASCGCLPGEGDQDMN